MNTQPILFINRTCPHCGSAIPTKTVTDEESGKLYQIPGRCSCDGAQAEIDADIKRDKEIRISAFQDLQQHAKFHSGDSITDSYFSIGWDNYNLHDGNVEAVADAKEFIHAMSKPVVAGISRRLLYLHGMPGTGKTMLAHLVNSELMRAGAYVAYVRASRLVNIAGDRDQRRWDYLLSTPRVIFIDDLGKENRSGYRHDAFESALFEIVDKITGSPNRGLIFTSEFHPGKLIGNDETIGVYKGQAKALAWRMRKLLNAKDGENSRISTIKKSNN